MQIPGFQIEEIIAEGGMSTVYRAVQQSLGRDVALKVMKPFDNPQHAERFLREARTIASLDHPNIITIHDVGVSGEHHYIAMEYLDGGSLSDRIAQGMTPDDALDLLESIASCLDFVHAHGVIHRDIKPSNILFHASGTAKLSDFGIATQLDKDEDAGAAASTFGSPYYLSPEQADGCLLDGRTDLYSLGIVFYEMLTGDKPYSEPSPLETIVAHLRNPIPLLPEHLSDYQQLLEGMLGKQPHDRFDSATRLIDAIREARRPRPLRKMLHDVSHLGDPGTGTRLGHAIGVVPTGARLAVAAVVAALVIGWLWPDDETAVAPTVARVADPPPANPSPAVPVRAAEAPSAPAAPQRTPVPVSGTPPLLMPLPPPEAAAASDKQRLPDDVAPETHRPAQPETVATRRIDTGTDVGTDTRPEPPRNPVVTAEHPADDPGPKAAEVDPDNAAGDTLAVSGPEESSADAASATGPARLTGPETAPIAELMRAGDQALNDYRLTTPRGDNAYDHYAKVLEIDPEHAGARAGMDHIADYYAALARKALGANKYRQAEIYVQRGLGIRGDHAGLKTVREDIRLAQQPEPVQPVAIVQPPPEPVQEPVVGHREQGTGNLIKDLRSVWRSIFD